jgi:hypothetical protein
LPTKREERGPSEFDMVPYPKEGVYYTILYYTILYYTAPKCKMLNGVGNPEQHLALFKATCGNTGGNEALLLLFYTK